MNLRQFLQQRCQQFPVISFCAVTFSLSWGTFFLYTFLNNSLGRPELHYLPFVQFSPALAAIVLLLITNERDGFPRLLRSLSNWHIGKGWIILSLLFEPLLFLGISFAFWITTDTLPGWSTGGFFSGLFAALVVFVVGLVRWGISEEIGWRGWLLPKLQQNFAPFPASLILAVIVTLWHFTPDAFLTIGNVYEGELIYGYYPRVVERLLISIPITMLITVIYNNTKGSLLVMMIFHSASNTSYFAIKESFGVVHTDFFKISMLILLSLMFLLLSFLMIKRSGKVVAF
ncbi:MAG: CPBP family intramembrane metalloprotease [bacterium]|nr:CPBP family intramembrane metalloprotease [bacterium]